MTNVSLSSLAWEAFWKVTLISPWVASEASKVLMVRNWTSVWDAIRSTHGASPSHGRTGRDKYGIRIDKGQEEKGMTEDELAGWYHRLHAHVFE